MPFGKYHPHPILSGRAALSATEKERILHWETCLKYLWEIPEPPEGWLIALDLRDRAGLTKYGPYTQP